MYNILAYARDTNRVYGAYKEVLTESEVIEMEEKKEDNPLPPPVGIVYNLKKGSNSAAPDDEAEYDNLETVLAIQNALMTHGYQAALFEADDMLLEKLLRQKPKLVFNIAEGRGGRAREAQIPALLNMLGIPFTGSDETTLCVALDKALSKRLLSTYHIKTPHYAVFEPNTPLRVSSLHYPVIVKPNAEGSSKGISELCIAKNARELKELVHSDHMLYGESFIAEEYIEGREFTVGVLGNGKDAKVFSPMEIRYKQATQGDYHVYSYQVKQDYKRYVEYSCPAQIPAALEKEMTAMARRAFEVLACRDFARVDFRVDAKGVPYFIEINPLPGLAPGYSDYPMLAEFCGTSYDELVCAVLEAAIKRLGLEAEISHG